jgi:hypothetical protein
MGLLGWIAILVIGGIVWTVWSSRSSAPRPGPGPQISSPPVAPPPVSKAVPNPAPVTPPVAQKQPDPTTPPRPSPPAPDQKNVSLVPSTADVVKQNLEKTKKALEHYTSTINTSRYGERASNAPDE